MIVIVVFAPVEHADRVRDALAGAGAGHVGNYSACSFSARGQGRFRPESGANPTIGSLGSLEVVEEVRIEAVCPRDRAKAAVAAMIEAHPYEEVAYHCYEALTIEDL